MARSKDEDLYFVIPSGKGNGGMQVSRKEYLEIVAANTVMSHDKAARIIAENELPPLPSLYGK